MNCLACRLSTAVLWVLGFTLSWLYKILQFPMLWSYHYLQTGKDYIFLSFLQGDKGVECFLAGLRRTELFWYPRGLQNFCAIPYKRGWSYFDGGSSRWWSQIFMVQKDVDQVCFAFCVFRLNKPFNITATRKMHNALCIFFGCRNQHSVFIAVMRAGRKKRKMQNKLDRHCKKGGGRKKIMTACDKQMAFLPIKYWQLHVFPFPH